MTVSYSEILLAHLEMRRGEAVTENLPCRVPSLFDLGPALCTVSRHLSEASDNLIKSQKSIIFAKACAPAELRIPMPDDFELLRHIYDRFNARDIETVLAALHQDVLWANGMEGGHLSGKDGVRSYWTHQWAMIDPHVEPVEFSKSPEGATVVQVHQVVRDLKGNLLSDKMVGHVFWVENGLIRRFDISGL